MVTKAEMQEEIEGLKAQLTEASNPSVADDPDALEALREENSRIRADVERLMLYALTKNDEVEPVDEDVVTARNSGGSSLAFTVTDVTGRDRYVRLRAVGDTSKLSRAQLAEARERVPHFFEHGWISIDGEKEDNPNLILDMDKFLEDLEDNELRERVDAITAKSTLTRIFHHIETMRFAQEETIEGDGEDAVRTLEENDIDPKLIGVEIAVQRRLAKLHGIHLSLDDS